MRILIVDDNDVALTVLQNALEAAGHVVVTARDGQEAFAMLYEHRCRIVISDWEMPQMNGVDLCRAIRAADFQGYIYFMLLTGHTSTGEKVEGLNAGADDFIVKPFDPAELLARVRAGERVLSLETREMAIFAMAKLAESRDPETGWHLERVRSYSKVLAQHLSTAPKFQDTIDQEFVRLIYLTSPLHDIGKVGIPDGVLLKPGRLSDREFEIMKSHTTIGAQTLDAALQLFPEVKFLQMAQEIALGHHERVDGTGYPRGLKGDDIPLSARIVALADVYDALASKRVYKNAFTHEVAKSIILKDSGTHFDSGVVEAFIAEEDQFIAIRGKFAEPQVAAAA